MAGCLPSRVGAEGHILLQVVPLSPSNTSLRAVQTADACPGGGVAPARGGGAKTGRKAPGKGTAGEPEGFGVGLVRGDLADTSCVALGAARGHVGVTQLQGSLGGRAEESRDRPRHFWNNQNCDLELSTGSGTASVASVPCRPS